MGRPFDAAANSRQAGMISAGLRPSSAMSANTHQVGVIAQRVPHGLQSGLGHGHHDLLAALQARPG